MFSESDSYVITPIGPIVNLDVLIDAQVQATVYDCAPFRYQKFVGTITEVKLNKYGTFVYFKTPDLVGGKWIKLDRVLGYAHTEEPEPAALPAHQTDKGRITGHVTYINTDYGYIFTQGASYRFNLRSVLGAAPLSKGTAVTFAGGVGLNAVSIVVTGNAASEAAYTVWVAVKAAAKEALPRARRRDLSPLAKTI